MKQKDEPSDLPEAKYVFGFVLGRIWDWEQKEREIVKVRSLLKKGIDESSHGCKEKKRFTLQSEK